VHGAATQHVQVQVKDRLATEPTRVDHEAIPTLTDSLEFGDLDTNKQQVAQQAGIGLGEITYGGYMFAGYHQNVSGRLGMNVVERHCLVVFMNNSRRDLFLGDPAKDAVAHVSCPLPVVPRLGIVTDPP
jgi:hypothetical protein